MADASELRRDSGAEPLFGSFLDFLETSIGSKVLMAVTGAFLWVFLVGHLAGNLTAYIGAETFNGYAEALHSKPALLWVVRIAMIFAFPLHMFTSFRTTQMNRAARPIDYAASNQSPARMAAKYMILSGLVLVAFLGYHLAHFTWRATGLGPDAASLTPYAMFVRGFQNPLIAGFYIVGVFLLGQHLSHGLYSMFQHVGLWGRRWTPWLNMASLVVGYGMSVLFATFPVAVLIGVIKP